MEFILSGNDLARHCCHFYTTHFTKAPENAVSFYYVLLYYATLGYVTLCLKQFCDIYAHMDWICTFYFWIAVHTFSADIQILHIRLSLSLIAML